MLKIATSMHEARITVCYVMKEISGGTASGTISSSTNIIRQGKTMYKASQQAHLCSRSQVPLFFTTDVNGNVLVCDTTVNELLCTTCISFNLRSAKPEQQICRTLPLYQSSLS
jgi:hypothetical protein